MITKMIAVKILKRKCDKATCFLIADHPIETNKAVDVVPIYAPISDAHAISKGMICWYNAVITITVIAELDCIITVPTNQIITYRHRCRWIYLLKSIVCLRNAILSLRYSKPKNIKPIYIRHKKTFLYLGTNRDHNHPIAIIGKTIGSISNHKPNNHTNASIKTDHTFIPITIPTAVCKTITPLPTSARSKRETALLLCKILTNQTPVKIAFHLVLIRVVTRCWILAVLYLAISSILSSAYKKIAIPKRNSHKCDDVTRDRNEDISVYNK